MEAPKGRRSALHGGSMSSKVMAHFSPVNFLVRRVRQVMVARCSKAARHHGKLALLRGRDMEKVATQVGSSRVEAKLVFSAT